MEKVKENYQGAAKKKNGEPREQEHGILKNEQNESSTKRVRTIPTNINDEFVWPDRKK